tara:strand:- start:56 stop:490 length:435 start_codon:yes stop_codon:yes gene_type:complete
MAKLGRYSAQRKKVENVSGDLTLVTADCGTLFTVGGSAATINLPTVASCGAGWWAEFWVNNTSPAQVIIQAQGTNLIFGFVLTTSDNDPNVQINPPAATGGTETVTLLDTCEAGDHVRIWCDGTNYFMDGQSRVVDAITAVTEL